MKVPQATPQVGLNAAPQVRQSGAGASLAAFGGVQAGQTEQLAKGLAGVADALDQRMQLKAADEIAKTEAEFQTRINLWQADAAKNRRADKASGLTVEADEWVKQQREELAGGLTNPYSQRAFTKLADRITPSVLNFARRHEDEQGLVALKANTTANSQAAIDAALLDPSEENLANRTYQLRRNAATITAAEGLTDPEVTNQLALKATTEMHIGVVGGLINADRPDAAAAHLEKYKDHIDAAKMQEMRGKVTELTETKEEQDIAVAAYGNGADLQASINSVRGKYDGKKEDRVIARMKDLQAEAEHIKSVAQKNADESALKGFIIDGRMPSRMERLGLSASANSALNNLQRERATGASVATNWKVYDELRALARTDPAAFAAMNLYEKFPYLNAGHREQLLDLQGAVARGGVEATRVTSLEQQIGDVHNVMKWTGSANAEIRGQFDSALRAEIEALGVGKPKGWQPDYETVEAVKNRLLIKEDAPWNKKDRYAFQIPADERGRVTFQIPEADRVAIATARVKAGDPEVTEDDVQQDFRWAMFPETQPQAAVPPGDRDAIVRILTKNKRPVTEANILAMYNLRQNKTKEPK